MQQAQQLLQLRGKEPIPVFCKTCGGTYPRSIKKTCVACYNKSRYLIKKHRETDFKFF